MFFCTVLIILKYQKRHVRDTGTSFFQHQSFSPNILTVAHFILSLHNFISAASTFMSQLHSLQRKQFLHLHPVKYLVHAQ